MVNVMQYSNIIKVALETYEMMLINIKRATIRNLCLSILTFDKDQDLVVHFP